MSQRLRITYGRYGGMRFVSHLETMKLWERVFRRAGWHLSYSHGFNPRPKISFAAALPVGVAAEAELMDILLEEPREPEDAVGELNRHLPSGSRVVQVEEIRVDAPVLQKVLRAAEYRALCPGGTSARDVLREIARALAADALPRQRVKQEGKSVSYDLRPMIYGLRVDDAGGEAPAVWMELRTDTQGAGRPDEVLREIGMDPADCAVTRVRLLLNRDQTQRDEQGAQD